MQFLKIFLMAPMDIKVFVACLLIGWTSAENCSTTINPTATSSSYLHRFHNAVFHDISPSPMLEYAPLYHTHYARPQIPVHTPIVAYHVPIVHQAKSSVTINTIHSKSLQNSTTTNNDDLVRSLINLRFNANQTNENSTLSKNNTSSVSSSSVSFRNLESRFNNEVDHTSQDSSSSLNIKTHNPDSVTINAAVLHQNVPFYTKPIARTLQLQQQQPIFYQQQHYVQQQPIYYRQEPTYVSQPFIRNVETPIYNAVPKTQIIETPGTVVSHATFTGFGTHYEW